jgi:hypothetical protein
MDVHDSRDGEDLYRVLRDELIPLYYQRDRDGLPRGWIKRMKRTIRTLGWRFNADRMVMDYTLKCYIPAAGGTSSEITRIHDVLCDGGGFLGPAEGSETAFYPSGKLHQCYLAKNQVVQGVPCAQGGDAGISSWPRPRTLFPRRRPSAFLPARGGFRRPEEKHDLEVGCKIGGHFGLAHREPGVAVGTHSGARRRMGLFDRPHQRRQRRRV